MIERPIGTAAAIKLLLVACALQAVTVAAAAWPLDEARPLVNPRYLPPWGPEGPWAHVPMCQVMVKTRVVPLRGVTQDDLRYCRLPPYASRHPSDPCTCVLPVGGVPFAQNGMVVWVPSWYRPVVYP
jgi:hypothetical protein